LTSAGNTESRSGWRSPPQSMHSESFLIHIRFDVVGEAIDIERLQIVIEVLRAKFGGVRLYLDGFGNRSLR
jgi:hypothetical protein